jgi:hypothetical protein
MHLMTVKDKKKLGYESGKSYKGKQFFQQQAVEELRSGDMSGATQHSITGFLMIQMTARAGIKKHGDAAVEAMFKEFLQLDDKTVFEGVMPPDTITQGERSAALFVKGAIEGFSPHLLLAPASGANRFTASCSWYSISAVVFLPK